MREEISHVEERVTNNLMKQIEPSLNSMRNEIQDSVDVDIRRLIKEEMALQKMAEAKNIENEKSKDDVLEETAESDTDGNPG